MSIDAISRLRPGAWHIPLLLFVSIGFESLFFRHGMNRIDEGWPLYAAKQLLEGGTLYHDVFFVFPPGHLLAAWLGQLLDPPGLLFARGVYLALDVAACLGVYLLGRRVMPAPWALLGALLLAVGAPSSHLKQLLFGYRYLALAMLALWAFARRLDTGKLGWTFAAGLCTGVALGFRLTPAFATAVAIGVGILVCQRRPSDWLREGGIFAAGLASVALPLVAVLLWHAGPEALVSEVLRRPVAMTAEQSLTIPALAWPDEWTRRAIRNAFVAVQFRGYALLYAAYLGVLGVLLVRALRRREPFEHTFLLVLVTFGALYFGRTLGRSDEPHLDSALPPACLLMAHALSQLRRLAWPAGEGARRGLRFAVCAGFFAGFVFATGSDYIAAPEQRGQKPFRSTDSRVLATNPFVAGAVDWCVENIQAWTEPGDVVLDLTASPLLFVLADRNGPGHADIVMPGTFRDEAEERRFVARLEARPPALVIWPTLAFDRRPERSVAATAPRLTAWVQERYAPRDRRGRFALWAPKDGALLD